MCHADRCMAASWPRDGIGRERQRGWDEKRGGREREEEKVGDFSRRSCMAHVGGHYWLQLNRPGLAHVLVTREETVSICRFLSSWKKRTKMSVAASGEPKKKQKLSWSVVGEGVSRHFRNGKGEQTRCALGLVPSVALSVGCVLARA